jgi:hypothetical protein
MSGRNANTMAAEHEMIEKYFEAACKMTPAPTGDKKILCEILGDLITKKHYDVALIEISKPRYAGLLTDPSKPELVLLENALVKELVYALKEGEKGVEETEAANLILDHIMPLIDGGEYRHALAVLNGTHDSGENIAGHLMFVRPGMLVDHIKTILEGFLRNKIASMSQGGGRRKARKSVRRKRAQKKSRRTARR